MVFSDERSLDEALVEFAESVGLLETVIIKGPIERVITQPQAGLVK
ncbi:hypothetical protein S7335_3582 [Synechococcus sp. PCC 7335]|nr:hypothetical protein S7335_3582 [Synechococcus sp. PCC 7335]